MDAECLEVAQTEFTRSVIQIVEKHYQVNDRDDAPDDYGPDENAADTDAATVQPEKSDRPPLAEIPVGTGMTAFTINDNFAKPPPLQALVRVQTPCRDFLAV